jgi:hypothetical protein
MDAPSPDLLRLTLRRILAALQGLKHNAVLIGALGRQAWGCAAPASGVEILTPSGESHRPAIFSAARGEGLQQVPDQPLRLRLTDAKLGGSADVDLVEAATPFHKQVISRAQERGVFGLPVPVASCEDLILLCAATDRAAVVELLRRNAARIDAAYLKREAEAAGNFGAVKSAWQEAKQQG